MDYHLYYFNESFDLWNSIYGKIYSECFLLTTSININYKIYVKYLHSLKYYRRQNTYHKIEIVLLF